MRVLIGCEFSGVVRDAFVKLGHQAVSCDFLPTESPGVHYCGDVREILDGWMPVSFSAECDPDGDGWCSISDCDIDSCLCIGPTQDGIEYKEIDGQLFGRPIDNPHWDIGIFHPPCTYLNSASVWALKDPDYIRYPGVGYHQRVKAGTLTGELRRKAQAESVEFVKTLWNAPIKKIAIENPVGQLSTLFMPPTQTVHPYQFGHDASKNTALWLKGLPPLTFDPAQRVQGRMVNGKERWSNQTDSGQSNVTPSAKRWADRSVTYSGIAAAMASQWGQSTKKADEH